MALIEIGRMCVKKYGRDAGSRAVITAVEKDGNVKVITALRPKERKCNPLHLEFLNEVIDTKDRAQIFKALGIQEKVQQKTREAKTENKKA
jgi:ribosomal protein L14E/L6E/L27E